MSEDWALPIPATAILPDEAVAIVLTAAASGRLRKLTLSRSAADAIVVTRLRVGPSIAESRDLLKGPLTPAGIFGKEQPETLDEPVASDDVVCLELRNISDRRTVIAGVLLGTSDGG